MDISALIPSTAAAPQAANPPARSGEGFARSLEQASARQPAAPAVKAPARTSSSASSSAPVSERSPRSSGENDTAQVTASTPPAAAQPGELVALLNNAALPASNIDPEGAALPAMPADFPQTGAEPLAAPLPGNTADYLTAQASTTPLSTPLPGNAADYLTAQANTDPLVALLPSSARDSLQQISSRLQLIEQAGLPAVPDGRDSLLPAAATQPLQPGAQGGNQPQATATLAQAMQNVATPVAPASARTPNGAALASNGTPASLETAERLDSLRNVAAVMPPSTAQTVMPTAVQPELTPQLPAQATFDPAGALAPIGLRGDAAQQSLLQPATLPGTPSATLAAPLGSSSWQQGLGQQLITLHQNGGQRVELHLHPAELGPLSISLKIGETAAHAHFLSAHPQVRAAVELALPQLREALAEQGITLGEASVGDQRQPREQGESQADRNLAANSATNDDIEALDASTTQPGTGGLILGQIEGRVDLYA